MKYVCLCCFLLAANHLLAQSSFEGKIRYTVTSQEKPSNAELTIFFGKPGFRLEIVDTDKIDKEPETLIINLDSGKIFTLMTDKKYKETILRKQKTPTSLVGKTIAGYATQAVSPEFIGLPRDFTSLFGNSILYTSNDLKYAVPAEYKGCPELMMVNDGKIVLGGDFFFSEDAYPDLRNDTVKDKDVLFRVLAEQVIPQKIEDSLFLLSPGYVKWSYDYSMDTTIMETDTALIEPAKPLRKNNKKHPKKKKPTTKQSATRHKND